MTEDKNQPGITFAGALPPPVTGKTVFSAAVVDALAERLPVQRLTWSREKAFSSLRWRLTRTRGVLSAMLTLLLGGRRSGRLLMQPVNSGWGLLFNLALAAVGKLLGYRLVLHHHGYKYIDRRDWRTALLERLVGPRDIHIMACDRMMEEYTALYATAAPMQRLPPTLVTMEEGSHQAPAAESGGLAAICPPPNEFTVGFLSNLTLEKGIAEVLETFGRVAKKLDHVRMVVAGPCRGELEQALLDRVLEDYPEQVEYIGPVYGEDKAEFFQRISVFLFPTKSESWGIVLNESMGAGRPVIASARGCICSMVVGDVGVVVAPEADFAEAAAEQIERWVADPSTHESACRAASARARDLEADAIECLESFLDTMEQEAAQRP